MSATDGDELVRLDASHVVPFRWATKEELFRRIRELEAEQRDRHDERAMAIVVHLAADPAPTVGDSMGCQVCTLCQAESRTEYGPIQHRDGCPWADAQRLLADIAGGK